MRDDAGFTSFVLARGPALKRLAWLLTTDGDAAEDLVQEALARVFPRWDRIEPAARESYVRMTMRSIWIDGWRRRGGRQIDLVADVPDRATADAHLDATATRLALDEALARLTDRQRTVLVLRFYEDLTEVQTAEAMGCTASTVKSQTRHALQRLRDLAPHLADAFDPGDAEPTEPPSGRGRLIRLPGRGRRGSSGGGSAAGTSRAAVAGSGPRPPTVASGAAASGLTRPPAAAPDPEPGAEPGASSPSGTRAALGAAVRQSRPPSGSMTVSSSAGPGRPSGPALSVSGPTTGEVGAPVDVACPPPSRQTPASRVVIRLSTPGMGEEVPDEPA